MDEDLKARLLKHRVPEGTVELDGIGTVRVRGLSRGEVFAAQKTAKDTESQECRYLALGMVDPELTEDEVRQWQASSPAGELEAVVEKIKELSGLGKAADKSGVPGVRDEPGPGVRVLPGDEAVDDGDAAAGADEQ